jgi:hypothetical protein
VVSYLYTPEIAGFLADHAEFRPAPLTEIAALYYQAWTYLHHDYRVDAHLLSVFAFGRGNYSYITREREWQQTTGFFGKLANSHVRVIEALRKGSWLSAQPTYQRQPIRIFSQSPDVKQEFGWFDKAHFVLRCQSRLDQAGVVRYLPVPHGLRVRARWSRSIRFLCHLLNSRMVDHCCDRWSGFNRAISRRQIVACSLDSLGNSRAQSWRVV